MKTWWAWAASGLLLAACAGAPPAGDTPREPRNAADNANPERLAKARLELAGLYFSRGQGSTALEEIRAALAAKPDMAEAWGLRALVYASLGETKLAEDNFQRALQLVPGDGGTMHNYAWFMCQERRFAEADQLFARAMAQPQYRDAPRTLMAQGVCQARAGRWSDAERTLSRSFELDASNPMVAFNLSEVLLRRGELERARFYVRRINSVPEQVSAQSLWLAARIERRLGNFDVLQEIGRQLHDKYPQAPETLLFDRGRFDD